MTQTPRKLYNFGHKNFIALAETATDYVMIVKEHLKCYLISNFVLPFIQKSNMEHRNSLQYVT